MVTPQNVSPASFSVLVLAPNSWHGQWVNRQQLFSRLGRSHPVLYSTGGWFTWDRHTADWRSARWMGGFELHDSVWVDESPRLLMRSPKIRTLDAIALQVQVRRWARFQRGLGAGPLVAYVFHPMFLPYVKPIQAQLLVYHAYDLYDHTPGWNRELEQAERELVKAANLVVTASEQIANALRAKVNREIRVLPNGADIDAIERARHSTLPPPPDLSSIPRPRLGWVGGLRAKVDYDLVAKLARRRPDWNFVFVGGGIPVSDTCAESELAEFRSLPNVFFLGGKPVSDVPSYLKHMDVNLMFYRITDSNWIQAIYPLKLHEYLATGHPVVSADVASVRPFSHVVKIVSGADEWHAAIEEALSGGGRGTPEQRRAVAAENGWNQRVGNLDSWLTELVNSKFSLTRTIDKKA